jgi:hypothetical protein
MVVSPLPKDTPNGEKGVLRQDPTVTSAASSAQTAQQGADEINEKIDRMFNKSLRK